MIALKNFVINFLNNRLEPYIKSESTPETSSGPVIDVAGRNFEEMVLNNGKDTFIYLYIPWCDKCQELIATFEEAAQMLSKEDIVFTKINCAANELPSPYETGETDDYPILYWAPKDKKRSPMEFEGMAFVDDLIKFIAQRATNELNGWDRNGNVKREKTEL